MGLLLHEGATAKVDNVQTRGFGADFDQNVCQFDVPVKHAFTVYFKDCSHQLSQEDLR